MIVPVTATIGTQIIVTFVGSMIVVEVVDVIDIDEVIGGAVVVVAVVVAVVVDIVVVTLKSHVSLEYHFHFGMNSYTRAK